MSEPSNMEGLSETEAEPGESPGLQSPPASGLFSGLGNSRGLSQTATPSRAPSATPSRVNQATPSRGLQATPSRSFLRGTPGRTPRTGPRARNDLGFTSSLEMRALSFMQSPSTTSSVLQLQLASAAAGDVVAAEVSDDEDAEVGQGATVWGTTIEVPFLRRRIRRFLKHFTETGQLTPKYEGLLRQCCVDSSSYLELDCGHLHAFDPSLYEHMISHPASIMSLIDLEVQAMAERIAAREDLGFAPPNLVTKPFNLLKIQVIRDQDPSDINKLISVRGMVTRTSGIIPELQVAVFKCETCGHKVEQPVVDGRIDEPSRCQSCDKKWTMSLQHNLSSFSNQQIVKVQEVPDAIPEGETPHSVTMLCYDEMVDTARPGDRVVVTGIVRAVGQRINPRLRLLKSVYKTHIDILHVRREEVGRRTAPDAEAAAEDADGGPDPMDAEIPGVGMTDLEREEKEEELRALGADPEIYEKLVASFAPSIWELDDVKKGILCQLFGGVPKEVSGGKTRGDMHVLMVGDPGVAKSQLLTFAHRLAPRGMYTSGRGSSAVGLTAYLAKDPETREMVLESGALVLSDKGLCAIDEFDKMTDSTRSMLHEVMEQQTVSVAKAGIVTQLNARTSVLAAANPVGSRYNPRISVVDNIQLPPSLISRFDLIYLLLDKADEAGDKRLARHLISLFHTDGAAAVQAAIPMGQLKDYIAHARAKCHPELSEEATVALKAAYLAMRREGSFSKTITATPRQLESMIRISEALARMRLSSTVLAADVEEAVRLMKAAMKQVATDPETGLIDMDIIQTGMSRTERRNREKLAEEILAHLTAKPSGLSAEELSQALAEQSNARLSTAQILAAIPLIEERVSLEAGRYRLKEGVGREP